MSTNSEKPVPSSVPERPMLGSCIISGFTICAVDSTKPDEQKYMMPKTTVSGQPKNFLFSITLPFPEQTNSYYYACHYGKARQHGTNTDVVPNQSQSAFPAFSFWAFFMQFSNSRRSGLHACSMATP